MIENGRRMRVNYSDELTDIMDFATEEAYRLESPAVIVEHLVLAIIRDNENDAYKFIAYYIPEVDTLKHEIEEIIRTSKIESEIESVTLTKDVNEVLDHMIHSEGPEEQELKATDLLRSILEVNNSLIANIFIESGLTPKTLDQFLKSSSANEESVQPENPFQALPKGMGFPENAIRIDASELKDKLGINFDKFVEKLQDSQAQINNMNQEQEVSMLAEYGVDLIEQSEIGNLDNIVGRSEEIDRVLHVLSKKRKNNAVLIGDPGVGKTAIVEAIADRLRKDDVPYALLGKRLISVDISSMVSGTRYRGEFEARMTKLINEVMDEGNIILFFDEIHNLIGAGNPSGSLDAANILKPALAKGHISCIGTTTYDEYREFFEDNQALERRFEKIYIEEPDNDQSIEILQGAKEYYENFHNVKFTDDALETAVKLSERYITDRNLPDKAINLLDEAGAKRNLLFKESEKVKQMNAELDLLALQKESKVEDGDYESAAKIRTQEIDLLKKLDTTREKEKKNRLKRPFKIGTDEIKKTISLLTGIPVSSLSLNKNSKIINLETNLKKEIVGQPEAIEKLVKSLKRNYAGLRNPNKPIGTFIFLGSTGVGKTQLAKSLSNLLFDNTDALIRFDMSEFMDKASVSRLVGTSPGYVGYEEGGELTEKLKHNPYSVVLFDEIEKAHKDIFNILLQILDEGMITDGHGRTVNMKNSVIILTSNIGVKKSLEFGKGIGFNNAEVSNQNSIIEKELKKTFSPEFLNRIDDIVFFKSLEEESILKIISLKLNQLFERASELGIEITATAAAKKEILRQAYNVSYGARPIERKIQELIENEISELIIHKEINKNDRIKIKFANGKFDFEKQPNK